MSGVEGRVAGEITSIQTDSIEVALIIAAANATERWEHDSSENYIRTFTVIYQGMAAAHRAANPQQPIQSSTDPRLDAGT